MAVFCNGTNLTLSNDSLNYNKSVNFGGGLYVSGSTVMSNCVFLSDSSTFGGGLYTGTGTFSDTRSRFINNYSLSGGGGFYNDSSPTTLTSCIFSGNTSSSGALGSGGGFQQHSSNANIYNSVFTGNKALGTADDGGAGIMVYGGSVTVEGCTFSNNTTTSTVKPNANAISTTAAATISVQNSIAWGTAAAQVVTLGTNTFNNSDIRGLTPTGTNLNIDPGFINAADPDGADNVWATADDGLELAPCSAAINTGSNALIPGSITTDVTGVTTRILQTTVDMGAYEAAAKGHIVYVNGAVAVTGNGTSWASAYKTVTEALNYANSITCADTIWVAAGTYYPMINSTTKATSRDSSFRILRNGVELFGGFNGTETAFTQRNINTNLTTLSGDLGVVNNTADNAYHVITAICGGVTQFDTTTIVDGFTITGGNANGPGFNYNGSALVGADGGGIEIGAYATGAQNKMLLQNSIITGNNAGVAGGVYCGGYSGGISSPTVRNCTISYNTASDVGGLHSYSGGTGAQSQASVSNCRFIGNKANQGGAMGAYIQSGGNSSPTVTNCVFENDTAVNTGGAINVYGSASFTINNCVFAGNITTNAGAGGGGAINMNGGNAVTISGSTFSNNTTASTGTPASNAINL